MKTSSIVALSHGVVLFSSVRFANSLPTVSFPINSQLPPVARVGQFFTYSFSPYTFQSDDNGNITYSFGDHPDWLSLDNNGRLLSGTPADTQVPPGDVVGQTVEIIATDDTGSATLNATVVVARHPGPQIQVPISAQISNFGNYSAPSSLLSYPSTAFSFTFSPDTFTSQPGLNYYAASENNSPLPAWINFDPATLTFSGQAPGFESLVQPPQSFGFELIASDVVGFSAASVSFSIVVGSHKLTTANPTITLNTSRSSKLSYHGLESGIHLDGKPITPGELQVTTADMPGWLSFDSHTWEIAGTPGNTDHSSNFTIDFHDMFSDDLSVLVVVNVGSGLFKSTFHDLKFIAGQELEIDLSSYLKDPADANVEVSTDPDESWIKVDGLEISGRIPETQRGHLTMTVSVSSKTSAQTDSDSLGISFIDPKVAATATISTSTQTHARTTSTSTSSSTATTTPGSKDAATAKGDNTSYILLATLIPILVICLIIMLLVCICRRRKSKHNYITSKFRSQISKPVQDTLHATDSEATIHQNEKLPYGLRTEFQNVYPDKRAFAEAISVPSSSSGSSTTANSGHDHDLMVTGGAAPVPSPAEPSNRGGNHTHNNSQSNSDNQSWFTVDRTTTASQNIQSETSRSVNDNSRKAKTHSQHSDVTIPEGQQILLPTPSFFGGDKAFRDGLNLAFPDRNSIQPTPEVAYGSRKAHDRTMSSATTSSEALPLGKLGSQRAPWVPAGNNTIREDESADVTEMTDAGYETDLHPAPLTKLSSQQQLPRKGESDGVGIWYNEKRKSARSESSFGSTENWRIIGDRSPNRGSPAKGPKGLASQSYRELVEELEFHPSKENLREEDLRGAMCDLGEASRINMSESSEGSFRVFL